MDSVTRRDVRQENSLCCYGGRKFRINYLYVFIYQKINFCFLFLHVTRQQLVPRVWDVLPCRCSLPEIFWSLHRPQWEQGPWIQQCPGLRQKGVPVLWAEDVLVLDKHPGSSKCCSACSSHTGDLGEKLCKKFIKSVEKSLC